jgi:galacturonosyltransferase
LNHYIGEKKDIITYYHNAHAVILPSFHEGFPNVLLEAWACAKPVLVSDEADTASLLTKGHGGINFPAHSTEQMADAIESFIRLSSDQKQYQGKIGYQIIKKHYKFSKIAKAYAQLYYNLLEQK